MSNIDKSKKENIHRNHRKNMRQVYYNSGLESLPDHTVLELLLYFGIPMKDTNELAHQLLNHFGSFSSVLQADFSMLKKFPGMTENAACLLSMLLPLFQRYTDDLTKKRLSINSAEDAEAYLRPKFLGAAEEKMIAVFLDSSSKVISSKVISEGSVSFAELNIRNLISLALDTKAKYIILSHNHPSNIAAPSQDDVILTKSLASYLKAIDIHVTDHIILTSSSFFSMAQSPKFSQIFSKGENIG